ncbi:ABC transporter permease subunit [Ancylobacter oerskovii]|nr:ABC transporter permease subunit [Ancylobacter oerskovii]MBS7545025.1 ABC transporter permease subunit [Ancylobacter oerskovii]
MTAPAPAAPPSSPPAGSPPAKGRSLWIDAWRRLTANRAAVISAVYLVVMAVACLVGPLLTGHDYTTIYTDYVRVAPSLTPYPKPDALASTLDDLTRRMRLDLAGWREENGRVIVDLRSARPIDPRVTRYFDRSSSFEDSRVEQTGADGLSMTVSAAVARHYFLFGTDNTGRDLLTRTLIAGRVSLAIGLLAGLTAVVIGVIYGATAGYLGGRIDDVMMRIVDILYSLPFIFLVIMLVVFFGRNFVLMFIAVGAVQWLDMARIVRGQALSIRRQEYVQAALALGVSSRGILWRHVVPNTLGPVVVYMTLLVPQVILLESFLSYLGLGVQEPLTSWGVLIAQGAKNIPAATWLLIFPSIFLTSTLFALNFLGDGLRDALDPKDR